MNITITQVDFKYDEDLPAGHDAQDVPQNGFLISKDFLWTGGLSTCFAIAIYGTTPDGVDQFLLCHADTDTGKKNPADVNEHSDARKAVAYCVKSFGPVKDGTDLSIALIQGTTPPEYFEEAGAMANEVVVPEAPADLDGKIWFVTVYMYPGGRIEYATLAA
ncbi:hypothetical protein [Azospirillum isscasi]|uniref:Uncharacterized protein n=1 Tax=Azospirillum isscasi TaxID=3053926 RepID=A0ABU0WBW7_9PROT|nr:hypothetical protein [Azospirillum isscasi]MDQ2101676.1 hypothetical protein [Azospirillum isscasi]